MVHMESLQDQLNTVCRELSRHQVKLEQARRYLESVLQHSDDIVFFTDSDGILISFSKGGEKALGYSEDEARGTYAKDLAKDPAVLGELMASCRDTVRTKIDLRHKEGHTVPCNITLIHLSDERANDSRTVGICRDITFWKGLEEDLVRIDRLAEIGRLSCGIVHEINNPLAVISEISGWAKAVVSDAKGLGEEDREELHKALSHVAEQTRRCRGITHQLLNYARDSEPVKTRFDINELLASTVRLLKPELKHESIDIVFDFAASPLMTLSDAKMLEQLFVNLLTNAIYAVKQKQPERGRIQLKTARLGNYLEITISDNGTGIRREDQERIFDLFFTTKPPGKGTGLGLPICRKIVKRLGGEIGLESQRGVGTTFTVCVPSL